MVVSTRGVTFYGNRASLRGLAECLAWAADQPASEHAEVHVPWHLDPPLPGRRRSFASARSKGRPVEFELTFMAVKPKDLDRLQARQPRKY
jgi:hypothetical protein